MDDCYQQKQFHMCFRGPFDTSVSLVNKFKMLKLKIIDKSKSLCVVESVGNNIEHQG
jgi:hypothetical protein